MIRDPATAIYTINRDTQVVLDLGDRDNEVVNMLYGRLPVFRNGEFKFETDWEGMMSSADKWGWYEWTVRMHGLEFSFVRHAVGGRPSPDVDVRIYPVN